jgi:hypothetical protein
MKMKTSELIGPALDWAVVKCQNDEAYFWACRGDQPEVDDIYQSSELWSQGGPIIEREGIRLDPPSANKWWYAHKIGLMLHGPTPLIAAMRCYVAVQIGDEVEVPEKLL